MDPKLIIDDDYVTEVGRLCNIRGKELESILTSYTTILEEIKNEALMEGDVANSLQAYIDCVKLLKNQINTISANLKDICKSFIHEINDADEYLF